jgi:hypothetical protein
MENKKTLKSLGNRRTRQLKIYNVETCIRNRALSSIMDWTPNVQINRTHAKDKGKSSTRK